MSGLGKVMLHLKLSTWKPHPIEYKHSTKMYQCLILACQKKKENTTKRLWYITHIRYGWVGYLQIFRILFITLYCESCTDQNIKDGDVLICLFFISLFHKLLSWILQSNFNTPSWPADGTLCLKTTNPFQHSCFKMLQKLCFPNHLKAYINPFEAYLITFYST